MDRRLVHQMTWHWSPKNSQTKNTQRVPYVFSSSARFQLTRSHTNAFLGEGGGLLTYLAVSVNELMVHLLVHLPTKEQGLHCEQRRCL